MTKKITQNQIELICDALSRSHITHSTAPQQYQQGWAHGVRAVADNLASALATTNPRFDRARFLAACGVAS